MGTPSSSIDKTEEDKRKRMSIPSHECIYAGHEFDYDNPEKWYLINPQCGGKKQSPIAIFSRKLQRGDIAPLSFRDYDIPLSTPVEVRNNGHSVVVAINTTINGTRPGLTGGGVTDIYEPINIHFHWGSKTTKGSEHSINGKKYDLEMHIVHKNVRFPIIRDALDDPYGFVVLGILFKRSDISGSNNTGLRAVYKALQNLSKFDSDQLLNQEITMQSFLGNLNTEQFFKYRGSRTSPPCAEAVTWIIFSDIQPIKTKHLERFFTLFDDRDLPILNNFRPLQSSSLRRIYYHQSEINS